jgi:hypothetical protein
MTADELIEKLVTSYGLSLDAAAWVERWIKQFELDAQLKVSALQPKTNIPHVGVMAFVKWLQKEGWYEHSSKEFWYRNTEDFHKWPPDETATEKEVFEKFFGKQ